MPSAPTNLTVTYHTDHIDLQWSANGPHMEQYVWRFVNPGEGWNLYATVGGSDTTYEDTGMWYDNAVYSYKIIAFGFPDEPTDIEYTGIYSDTVSDTVTVSSITPTEVLGIADTVSDTITVWSLTPVEIVGMLDTVTDTVTVTDSQTGSQSLKTDYAYYWGTEAGVSHCFDPGYKSDNGVSILSMWRSKVIDFGELRMDLSAKWKTIYRISIQYVDLVTETPVIVSISTNGGSTWTSSTTTYVGTGSLATSNKDFHFTGICGQYFDVKIEYPSTDKTFQLISMDVYFEPYGEVVSA